MNLYLILQIMYLLFPSAVANMAPVFFRKINLLNYPIDFGMNFFGERLFGPNKTFRGLFFGIVASILVVFLQGFLYTYGFFNNLSLVNYSKINIIFFGFLVGFGVLFGDLIGSFIKRRLNFRPGEHFFILDQINGGIGFCFFIVLPYFRSWVLFFWAVLIWFVGHFIIKYFGYILGMYKEKI